MKGMKCMEYILLNEEYPFIEWNNQFIEDYTVFCDSDDNLTDDIEEAVQGPYEQWLKLNDYDPKTNTIKTSKGRQNVGKIGSNKERNRLNQFLKRNDFDPKTGTYRSEIPLADGSYARLPLYIGANVNSGGNIQSDQYLMNSLSFDNSRKFKTDGNIEDLDFYRNQISKYRRSIESKQHDLERETNERTKNMLKNSINRDKKQIKKYLTKLRATENTSLPELQRKHLSRSPISLSKASLMMKPKLSTNVLKHEEGHAYGDNLYSTANKADDKWDTIESDALNQPFEYKGSSYPEYPNGDLLNPHDKMKNERRADIYAVKHNPYVKSVDDAYNIQNGELKNLTDRYYKREQNKLKRELDNEDLSIVGKIMKEKELDDLNAMKKVSNSSQLNDITASNYARSNMLKSHLENDPEFQKVNSSRHKKTNKERSVEKKANGELPRKAKKAMKKTQSYKEYMI